MLLEEKKHVADEIEDDTGVVGGVRAQDRHADGEEGLVEEHDDQDDQDDHDDHNDLINHNNPDDPGNQDDPDLVVEDDQAVHDGLEGVVVLVGGDPLADGGEDQHVALPHDGHGDRQHPLDVERADEEEDRERPVLGAHYYYVKLCRVVPPK